MRFHFLSSPLCRIIIAFTSENPSRLPVLMYARLFAEKNDFRCSTTILKPSDFNRQFLDIIGFGVFV